MKILPAIFLVFALTASSTAMLHCQWLCAHDESAFAGVPCHGADASGTRIESPDHVCNHAPDNFIVVKSAAATGSEVLSPVAGGHAIAKGGCFISPSQVNDAGPPGFSHSIPGRSSLPLRI